MTDKRKTNIYIENENGKRSQIHLKTYIFHLKVLYVMVEVKKKTSSI